MLELAHTGLYCPRGRQSVIESALLVLCVFLGKKIESKIFSSTGSLNYFTEKTNQQLWLI